MSVLDRSALVDSPLADLHAIASELTIDGYRRLRRPELITAILDRQDPDRAPDPSTDDERSGAEAEETPAPRRRSRRGSRSRSTSAEDAEATSTESDDGGRDDAPRGEATPGEDGDEAHSGSRSRRSRSRSGATKAKSPTDDIDAETAAEETETEVPARTESRSPRSRRGRGARAEAAPEPVGSGDGDGDGDSHGSRDGDGGEETVEGVVELLPNGSGFVREAVGEPSDDDVYISAAQVKRCELVAGDRVAGPKRAPRRSERFASMVRIETINGRPASELADSVRFDDLPSTLPSERITLGSDDPTLNAIEWLTPLGRGSRVTITGAPRAGKSEVLRRLAGVLAEADDLTVTVALAGVRPEEISEWSGTTTAPAAAVSMAAAEDVQLAALEPVVDQARRLAARGEHAVVLIDGLDGLSAGAARRVMASARCIADGGSVTLIATATEPVGGETTVVALDVVLTSLGRFPNLDLLSSGTLRPEALVGDEGALEILRTRAEVLGEDED